MVRLVPGDHPGRGADAHARVVRGPGSIPRVAGEALEEGDRGGPRGAMLLEEPPERARAGARLHGTQAFSSKPASAAGSFRAKRSAR